MKNQGYRHSFLLENPLMTRLLLSTAFIFTLLFSSMANAAYWIIDYSGGEAKEFSLTREGKSLAIQAETLLQTGDKVAVLSETGVIRLQNDDDNSEIILNKDKPEFVVPEAKEPSTLIKNLYAMLSEWLTQASSEKVKGKSLSTRGDEPVLIQGASDWKNLIPTGSGTLTVYWSGGKAPFQVRLTDSDDKVIKLESGIEDNHTTLDGLNLAAGEYWLKVLGKSSSSIIQLNVVEKPEMSSLYTDIINSRAPQQIKNKLSVLALANQPDWLFYSLQLAEQHGLVDIKDRILLRDIPEFTISSEKNEQN